MWRQIINALGYAAGWEWVPETSGGGDCDCDGNGGGNGQNGLTPQIGPNGNWWIGTTDTGVKAQGPPGAPGTAGADGETPYIGGNGNWWIGTTDTGVKAQGQNGAPGTAGADGETPYIGGNGNWWIAGSDTGVAAAGPPGAPGTPGTTIPAWNLNFSIYGNSNSYDLNSNNGVSIFEFSRSDGSQIQPNDFKQYSEVSLGWHLSSNGSYYQSYLARLRPSFFNLPFPSGNDSTWKYTDSSSGDASVALEFTYEGMVCKQPVNAFKFYRNANDKIVLGIMYGPAYTANGSQAGKIFVNTGAPICRLGVRGFVN